MTTRQSIVVVDEISSFLHPLAVRNLVRILQTKYNSNQYIVSAHSTELLSSSTPTTVHLVKKSGFELDVRLVSLSQIDDLREVSELLGVSMADVFAAERIVWVEGQTEETCFPYICQRIGLAVSDIVFASVVATADFRGGRGRQLTKDLYARLSSAALPLMKSVSFSFDLEDLSPDQTANFRREFNERFLFLPRRNFESFLVSSDAVASLVVSYCPDLEGQVTPQAVTEWALAHGNERKYHASGVWNGDLSNKAWLAKVDGAALLTDLVSELSQQRLSYNKRIHSQELLALLPDDDVSLLELGRYIESLVHLARRDGGLR